ncbi:MAG TPA: hypothetical protein VGQ45_12670 [Gaiellales bacterium]|nr:hypothetical protein [Gaiellales bacterium]
MTDPRKPPAERAPEPGGDLVVEHVDDPRFALLTAPAPSEHGLRIDPATGRLPPPPRAQPPAPAVVRAPARARVASDRRRAGRLAIAALILPILVAAVIGIGVWLQGDSGGSPPAPAVSPRPPSFTVSTTVAATAPAPNGIAVAAAGNGGLWYQSTGAAVTRLAATDGSVNYTFDTARPALGLAVSGGSLLSLVNSPAGAELVFRDRGSGRVQSRLPLPGALLCSTPATACAPLVADGRIWAALAGGVARIDNQRATLTPVTGVLAIAGSSTTVWALTPTSIVALSAGDGHVLGATRLSGLVPNVIAAGAGAVWVAGTRDGHPQLLRFDGRPGRPPQRIALPAPATAMAAAGGAIWLALAGQGVRELDPSVNRLVDAAIALPDQNALLSIRPDQLWSVREAAGRASFTRIDLAAAGS